MKRAFWLFVLMLAIAARPGAAADSKWTMVRRGTLTLIGDQSASTLNDIASQIEQFRTVVATLIHNADRPLSLPTVVFVVGSRKALQPLVPLYNGKPVALGGYFNQNGDANYIVLCLEGFEESAALTYHEYTHLLVRNAVRSVPTWLNEGLAEYYSSYALQNHGRTALVGRPLVQHIALLRAQYIPLAELIEVNERSPLYNEGSRRSIFYAESWALTHYLMAARPDGRTAINTYATRISEGQSPADAFAEAFKTSPANFDKELRDYVQRFLYNVTTIAFAEKVAAASAEQGRAMTAGEVEAWLGDVQRRVQRKDEAATRIERAAAAEPRTAITQLALGLLRLEEKPADGIDAIARAAALAPDDFMTQYAYGLSLLRAHPQPTGEERTTALAVLKRAAMLNGSSSDAHAALAYAEMLSDTTLGDARASIERAIALSPGRLDYYLRYADIRVLQHEIEGARQVLAQVAAIKTDSRASSAASKRLAAIADSSRGPASLTPSLATGAERPNRSIEVPDLESPDAPRPALARFRLRPPRDGEQRELGQLLRIDCDSTAVRFTLQVAEKTLVATAARMEEVELISYLDDKDFVIACGPRTPPDRVFLTRRSGGRAEPGTAGTAVAVEFLPKDFQPQ